MSQAKLSYSSGSLSLTVNVLSVKGAAEPDNLTKFPGIIHELLDGSLSEQNVGARQNVEIRFSVMTMLQRRQLVDWWLDTTRTVDSVVSAPAGAPTGVGAVGGYLNGNYKYYVSAIDNVGFSAKGTISDVIATGGADAKITLSYAASTNARGYKIFRSRESDYNTWDVVGYSESTTFVDTGDTLGSIAASVYLADVTPPAAASALSVVCENELVFEFGHETELERLCTMSLRAGSIFLTAAKFPV